MLLHVVVGAQEFTAVLGAPVGECNGLLPVHAHNRVVVVRGVPEVFVVHGFVERIREISNPNQGIWVNVDDLLLKERGAIGYLLPVFNVIAVGERFVGILCVFEIVLGPIALACGLLLVHPEVQVV